MYRQFNERAGISIEQGTDKVPNDNRYYVLSDGKIVGGFRSIKRAEDTYRKLVAEKNLPPLQVEKAVVSKKHILQHDWDLRSNKSMLGEKWSPKGKKSGRYHKSR